MGIVEIQRYFGAVIKDGIRVICLDCLNDNMGLVRESLLDGEEVEGYVPIYLNEEWSQYPECYCCGIAIEYVTLLEGNDGKHEGESKDVIQGYINSGLD